MTAAANQCDNVVSVGAPDATDEIGEIEYEDVVGHRSRHHAQGVDNGCAWWLECVSVSGYSNDNEGRIDLAEPPKSS